MPFDPSWKNHSAVLEVFACKNPSIFFTSYKVARGPKMLQLRMLQQSAQMQLLQESAKLQLACLAVIYSCGWLAEGVYIGTVHFSFFPCLCDPRG